ncbi:MAG: 6-phosphofructokinase [Sphingobacteriales bacterium]|jgi:6-phosphofructokinase 1|nr:6-phosphofructokinase [Sphingobacteriales bacterium]MBP9140753.1 6-phosphofructokinase [Chitinophagales bacterium]MDA0197873.1 6-phosphofructokinase [Bacteroidota bacterium]MBK6889720.1 6-phosphofructokinase [Sphingobacteriales bacterium]MBK7527765.1 6-phosphofructokinase [Sphingobacteriales bacterium]
MEPTTIRKIGILTSGGDSPGMNACIRAVVRAACYHNIQITGIKRGYQGMIEGDFEEMNSRSVSNIIHRGGTILKSARCLAFKEAEGRKKAYKKIKKAQIDALVLIGGDGTFKGAHAFSSEYDLPVIGIPGTIDNDMYGTDYTIGYDTAMNTVVEAIDKIRDTADSHDRLFFIEVMGRDAGFIALPCGIATGAEAVLIPESITNLKNLVKTLKYGWKHKKTSSIVIVSEGDEAGGAFDIVKKVKPRLGNRYDIRVTILGHIQRGGNPSCFDRVLASRMGVAAVEGLLEGQNKMMVGIQNNQIVYVPLIDSATQKAVFNHNSLARIAEILAY